LRTYGLSDIVIAVVGNKLDKEDEERAVTPQMLDTMVKESEIGIDVWGEVSAKTGVGIDELFSVCARLVVLRVRKRKLK
jgi:GTPase SAR1 family protein